MKTKADLIRKVQEICSFWDASATNAALVAARKSSESNHKEASLAVARSDAAHECERRIIDAIHGFWPVSPEKEMP